mmetsp:Transcript_7744/g.23563  ORF Transcript_7744/g.23563 Transcript_7744/m.23563 type:complete len:218 (-) Transcript_7744:692-1345(-)
MSHGDGPAPLPGHSARRGVLPRLADRPQGLEVRELPAHRGPQAEDGKGHRLWPLGHQAGHQRGRRQDAQVLRGRVALRGARHQVLRRAGGHRQVPQVRDELRHLVPGCDALHHVHQRAPLREERHVHGHCRAVLQDPGRQVPRRASEGIQSACSGGHPSPWDVSHGPTEAHQRARGAEESVAETRDLHGAARELRAQQAEVDGHCSALVVMVWDIPL